MIDYKKDIDKYKGKEFGNWSVIDLADRKDKYNNTYYTCRCNLCGRKRVLPAKFVTDPKHKLHPFSCGCVSVGVYTIREFLSENNIMFEEEVTFKDLLSPKGGKLRFDFMIKVRYGEQIYNYAVIEYDGRQHTDIKSFMKITRIYQRDRAEVEMGYYNLCDSLKEDYCRHIGLHFLRITYSRDADEIRRQLTRYLDKIGYANIKTKGA